MENSHAGQETQSSGYWSHNFALLLVIVFFTSFASSMVSTSPVVFLVKSLAGTEEATVTFFGVLVAVASVAMIAANSVGGFLADRIGRKRVIILAAGMLFPSLLVYVFVPNLYLAGGVYFIHMFSNFLFQPAFTAFVADLSRVSSRGKAFGRFNVFWIGSTVPAPLIGGLLVDRVGLHFPFVVAAFVSLVGLIASFSLTSDSSTDTSEGDSTVSHDSEKTWMPFATVILFFGAIGFFTGLANGLLTPMLRTYAVYRLNVDATQLGLVFSIGSGLVTTLVQLPGGRLTDSLGRKPLMLISLLGAPFVVGIAFTGSVSQFILMIAGLVALGNIGSPAYQAWLMELVPDVRRAIAWGVINAVTGVGMFIGPFVSTWLYESQPWIVLPFIVAAVPWALQIPPILKLKETKTNPRPIKQEP